MEEKPRISRITQIGRVAVSERGGSSVTAGIEREFLETEFGPGIGTTGVLAAERVIREIREIRGCSSLRWKLRVAVEDVREPEGATR
jgi:hypothetical protein